MAKECLFTRGRPSQPGFASLKSCKTEAGSELVMLSAEGDFSCREGIAFILLSVGDEKGIQLVAVSQGKGKESQSWGKSARGENDLQCPAGSLPSS